MRFTHISFKGIVQNYIARSPANASPTRPNYLDGDPRGRGLIKNKNTFVYMHKNPEAS